MSDETTQTCWLGRIRLRSDRRSQAVRVWTTGGAPQDQDRYEIILDPFDDELWPERLGDVWSRMHSEEAVLERRGGDLESVELLAPVRPGKVLCVGRNYRAHAAELGNEVPSEPLMFHKPSSAVVGTGAAIEIPRGFDRVDMESELVAVIGKRGRNIAAADGLKHVAGYSLGNDVSNRDLQRGDKLWTRGKGFDTFAPLGPWVRLTTPGFALPPEAEVRGSLDGELRQHAPISAMVFDIPTVIAFISAVSYTHLTLPTTPYV